MGKKEKESFATLAKSACALHAYSRDIPEAEVSLVFIGDRRMRSLNRAWRKKDKTTDVLSFGFPGKGNASRGIPLLMGEIFISVPEARRYKKRSGRTLKEEIFRLYIHGMLHVVGFDHERSRKEALDTERLEESLFKKYFTT